MQRNTLATLVNQAMKTKLILWKMTSLELILWAGVTDIICTLNHTVCHTHAIEIYLNCMCVTYCVQRMF